MTLAEIAQQIGCELHGDGAVEITAVAKFARLVSLPELREQAALKDMVLLRKGSRLSVQPVTKREWLAVLALGKG